MGTPRKIMAATASALAAVSMGTVSLTAASVAAAPAATADASRAATTAGYQYRAYHGVDFLGSYNRTKAYRENKALRPVALSVGLQQSQKRYAAFWDSRPGPAWLQRMVSAGGYQKLFDTLTEPEIELDEGGNRVRPSYQHGGERDGQRVGCRVRRHLREEAGQVLRPPRRQHRRPPHGQLPGAP